MNPERGGPRQAALWCCLVAIAGGGLLSAGRSSAELVPAPGAADGRVRAAFYDGEQVYRLRGFVGYQIDLEFEPGETFVGLGAGDIEGLSYFGQDNHLFLKPKAARVATNLTVLTNRRHYQFDYTATLQHPGPENPDVIYVLRFVYPTPPSAAAEAAAAKLVDAGLKNASAERRQNTDYWYCGSPTLRPVFAADDGVHTRFRFAANADLPAIFVRSDDEGESLLNYSMEDGDVIVHRVARRFVLRRGKLAGCITNRGYGGGGLRLESGTVAPSVERRVQGGAP
jgi:type IV secretion system protein VirB9